MPRNTKPHRDAVVAFKGEKRSNATHASITDLDARSYKKPPGIGAMLTLHRAYADDEPYRRDRARAPWRSASSG